jgi:hypothetical protein
MLRERQYKSKVKEHISTDLFAFHEDRYYNGLSNKFVWFRVENFMYYILDNIPSLLRCIIFLT